MILAIHNVDILWFYVVDRLGQGHFEVAREVYDDIFITASLNHSEAITFDSEARHLDQWCRENGFDLYSGKQNLKVEVR